MEAVLIADTFKEAKSSEVTTSELFMLCLDLASIVWYYDFGTAVHGSALFLLRV